MTAPILVTGASGFLGTHVVRSLVEAGHRVIGTLREDLEHPVEHELCEWRSVDLSDHQAVTRLLAEVRPSHALHLAWYVKHGAFWHARENFDCVSDGLHLVRAFYEAGGQRFVGVGTCYEYDLASGWMTEDSTLLRPTSLYGVAKNSLRQLIEALCEQEGLSWAWGRVFFPFGFGEGSSRLVPSVVGALLAGTPTRCSDGWQIRDFMHAADVAAALRAVTLADTCGAFNVASGQPRTIRELVGELGEVIGRSDLVRFGDLDGSGQPPCIVANPAKLRGIGVAPPPPLRSRLAEVVESYRSLSAN